MSFCCSERHLRRDKNIQNVNVNSLGLFSLYQTEPELLTFQFRLVTFNSLFSINHKIKNSKANLYK